MVHFGEIQRMNQWWLWIILLIVVGFMWYAAFQQLILGKPFDDDPAPDLMLFIFWLLFGVGLPCFFGMHKLTTEVRDDCLYIRFSPYHSSKGVIIPFDEIVSCEAVIYSPIGEYGGWGIRFGFNGRAYNMGGKLGVRLTMYNGSKLLIGSKKAETFAEELEKSMNV